MTDTLQTMASRRTRKRSTDADEFLRRRLFNATGARIVHTEDFTDVAFQDPFAMLADSSDSDAAADSDESSDTLLPKYAGNDALYLHMAQRFNTAVRPRIEEELRRSGCFAFRRLAFRVASRALGIPGRRGVDISRGDHGKGYGDPSNLLFIEPAGRNRSRGATGITIATQDELTSCADDAPTTEQEAAAVAAAVERAQQASRDAAQMKRRAVPPEALQAHVVREERCDGYDGKAQGRCRCAQAHQQALWSFADTAAPGEALDFVGLSTGQRRKLHKQVGVLVKKSGTPLQLLHRSHDYTESGTTRLRVVMQPCRRGWDNYCRVPTDDALVAHAQGSGL